MKIQVQKNLLHKVISILVYLIIMIQTASATPMDECHGLSSKSVSQEALSKDSKLNSANHQKDNQKKDQQNFFACKEAKSSESSEQEPPKIGNFILPGSQQPGSLVGFGENIIDKNETIIYFSPTDTIGPHKNELTAVPSIVYGVTDSFSLTFVMPYAISLHEDSEHSSGIGDIGLQPEYAFFSYGNTRFTEQATIVGDFFYPSGSIKKDPNTGAGSPSFFLGSTYNRIYTHWFGFSASGELLTTPDGKNKSANQFLYQGGLGRNIFDIDSKWIFAGLLEANGQYAGKNKINGVIDNNSGGNIILLVPSLWISSKSLTLQFGVGAPVVQDLFGNQPKTSYLLTANLGWSFY